MAESGEEMGPNRLATIGIRGYENCRLGYDEILVRRR
jgi:hypothetical protein